MNINAEGFTNYRLPNNGEGFRQNSSSKERYRYSADGITGDWPLDSNRHPNPLGPNRHPNPLGPNSDPNMIRPELPWDGPTDRGELSIPWHGPTGRGPLGIPWDGPTGRGPLGPKKPFPWDEPTLPWDRDPFLPFGPYGPMPIGPQGPIDNKPTKGGFWEWLTGGTDDTKVDKNTEVDKNAEVDKDAEVDKNTEVDKNAEVDKDTEVDVDAETDNQLPLTDEEQAKFRDVLLKKRQGLVKKHLVMDPSPSVMM